VDDCGGCQLHGGRRSFLKQLMGLSVMYILPIPDLSGEDTVSYPIPAADGAFIDTKNDVILMRWQQSIYAFSLACPHQNTALRWKPELGRFQCPKHHSRYEPDGSFISGRATRGMDRFRLTRVEGSVVVDLGTLYSQKDDPAGWGAALIRL
jgi:Rieske Fe-S protein